MATIYISTISELQLIGSGPSWPIDGDYELANDIDASATMGWNGGAGFIPIASFTGSLNGAGFVISNFYINRPLDTYQALFEYAEGAYIHDLAMENISVISNKWASGIVAKSNTEVTFTNCSVTGYIQSWSNLAGIISEAQISYIDNCSVNLEFYCTDIYSEDNGGIVGLIRGGYIKNCTSTLEIRGKDGNRIGGIGGNVSDLEIISNCHASGTLILNGKPSNIGGFVGQTSNNTYEDCSTSIEITVVAPDVSFAEVAVLGGFAGRTFYDTFDNCSSTGNLNLSGIFYQIGGFVGYFLRNTMTRCFSTGNVVITHENDSCQMIGGFLGYASVFPEYEFSYCYSTGFVSVSKGSFEVGGFAGYMIGKESFDGGKVSYCFSSGNVETPLSSQSILSQLIGGFAGYTSAIDFDHCYSIGNAAGIYRVAGFITDHSGSAYQCFSFGNVQGEAGNLGGLFGDFTDYGLGLSNCYALGDVLLNSPGDTYAFIGGFAGDLGGVSSVVSNCYSIGKVTQDIGGTNYAGPTAVNGFAVDHGETVNSCYWDIETSEQATSGHGTGKTTAQMQLQSTYTGWSFPTIWKMREGMYPQFLLAEFSADNLSDYVPLTETFTNETTGWPDENAQIITRDWDFGDGSAHSSDFSPVHIYEDNGLYTVTLIETRNFIEATRIRIDYIQAILLLVDFIGHPTEGNSFLTVTFENISSDYFNTWFWDFGDELYSDESYSTERNPVHYYSSPGYYTVTLTASGSDSILTVVKTEYIIVNGPATYDIAPEPDKNMFLQGAVSTIKEIVGIKLRKM